VLTFKQAAHLKKYVLGCMLVMISAHLAMKASPLRCTSEAMASMMMGYLGEGVTQQQQQQQQEKQVNVMLLIMPDNGWLRVHSAFDDSQGTYT
jgi:hypothetical protein